MVLTKQELIALLQKEVRLLLHLTTKIDAAVLDYRPTPQRSTIELLRYLTMMGPGLVRYAKGEPMDAAATAARLPGWTALFLLVVSSLSTTSSASARPIGCSCSCI
jgi:hypothetical protein